MTRPTEIREWNFLHVRGEGYLVVNQFQRPFSYTILLYVLAIKCGVRHKCYTACYFYKQHELRAKILPFPNILTSLLAQLFLRRESELNTLCEISGLGRDVVEAFVLLRC